MRLFRNAEQRAAAGQLLQLVKILVPAGPGGSGNADSEGAAQKQGGRAAAVIGALAVLFAEDFMDGKDWDYADIRGLAGLLSIALLGEDVPKSLEELTDGATEARAN